MAVAAKHYDCPFCDQNMRSDHLKEHIAARHPNPAEFLDVSDNGIVWRRAKNPQVIYATDGSGTHIKGCCFQCWKSFDQETSSTWIFDDHTCKAKQIRRRVVAKLPNGKPIKKIVLSITEDMVLKVWNDSKGAFTIPYLEREEGDTRPELPDMPGAFNNMAKSLIKLSAENKALKAKAVQSVDPGPAVWKALREGEIPGFEEEERDSDDDTPLPVQDVPTIVSKLSHQFQAFRKALISKEAQVKRRFDADIAAQKAELEEQDKKLADHSRVIVDQEETITSLERKLKDREATIQALLTALKQKTAAPPPPAATESDSEEEAPALEVREVVPPVKKRVMMKSPEILTDHRTRLTQMNLV
jgi:hypothetical protein